MRACKDCQWFDNRFSNYDDEGTCRWLPSSVCVAKRHWCAQFHRKETEEGLTQADLDAAAKRADEIVAAIPIE